MRGRFPKSLVYGSSTGIMILPLGVRRYLLKIRRTSRDSVRSLHTKPESNRLNFDHKVDLRNEKERKL